MSSLCSGMLGRVYNFIFAGLCDEIAMFQMLGQVNNSEFADRGDEFAKMCAEWKSSRVQNCRQARQISNDRRCSEEFTVSDVASGLPTGTRNLRHKPCEQKKALERMRLA